MNGYSERNLVFDTSAILKVAHHYRGFQYVENLMKLVEKRTIKGYVNSVSFYEIISVLGLNNMQLAAHVITYIKNSGFEFIDATPESCKSAGMLKIKYHFLNLSMADWVIVQSAIEKDAEIINEDKEWEKVKEAKVQVI